MEYKRSGIANRNKKVNILLVYSFLGLTVEIFVTLEFYAKAPIDPCCIQRSELIDNRASVDVKADVRLQIT
jgi:hypothetical protein